MLSPSRKCFSPVTPRSQVALHKPLVRACCASLSAEACPKKKKKKKKEPQLRAEGRHFGRSCREPPPTAAQSVVLWGGLGAQGAVSRRCRPGGAAEVRLNGPVSSAGELGRGLAAVCPAGGFRCLSARSLISPRSSA